jgi:hypothetical protein
MTFLYPYVGDSHAIILHVARPEAPKGWKLPSYVHFNVSETIRFFEQLLGNQCIHPTVMED